MKFRKLEKNATAYVQREKKRAWKEEINRSLKKLVEGEGTFVGDGRVSIAIILLTVVAICLIISIIAFLAGETWALKLFGFGVVAPTLLAWWIAGLYDKRCLQDNNPFKPADKNEIAPSKILPLYLNNQISKLEKELLGEESRYQTTHKEVEEINRRARRVSEQLEIRLTANETKYLHEAYARALKVIEHSEGVLEKLKTFRGIRHLKTWNLFEK